MRKSFWGLLIGSTYSPAEGADLVRQYVRLIDLEFSNTLSQNSLAYYLHLYRRLAPGSAGLNKEPRTIGLVL